jgi:Leucine-rich repeat (LRR) protein
MLPLICALVWISSARGDEAEQNAIRLIESRKGNYYRDQKKPDRPIYSVSLGNGPVTDRIIAELIPLRNLRRLTFSIDRSSGFDGAALGQLSHLEELAFLGVHGSDQPDGMRPETMKSIAQLKSLTALELNHTKLSGRALRELAALKKLTKLTLHDVALLEEDLGELAGCTELAEMKIQMPRVNPGDLREGRAREKRLWGIEKIKKLSTLELEGDVTAGDVQDIAGARGLKKLFARSLPPDSVAMLAPLKELAFLHIPDSRLSQADMRVIGQFPKLTSLGLSGGRGIVTTDWLREQQALPELTELSLGSSDVSNDAFKGIAALPKLSKLDLYRTGISSAGFQNLATSKSLTHLYLIECHLTDESLKSMSQMTRLTYLDLAKNPVTDKGLAALVPLKSLSSLNLNNSKVTDDGLKAVSELGELTSLNLSGCPITDEGLKALAPLKKIETLLLANTKVRGEGLAAFLPASNLKVLSLSGAPVNAAGMKEIGSLSALNQLYFFSPDIADDWLSELTRLKSLTLLQLHSYALTDKGLRVLTRVKSLESLQVHHHCAITKDGVAEFKKALPNCRIFVPQSLSDKW